MMWVTISDVVVVIGAACGVRCARIKQPRDAIVINTSKCSATLYDNIL
jgi:hypothetical protein